MFIVILTWIYMMIVSLILGASFNKLWRSITGFTMTTPEMYILMGLAMLTVYAQFFSLFSGVGLGADAIITVICLLLLIWARGDLLCLFKTMRPRWWLVRLVIALAVLLMLAICTAQSPWHYDTYLYHAQTIRWIEEYGVVPGLGNLHHRFAYNSSFLVLQALFSFKFLYGVSMHTLNGFVSAVFFLYCIFSIFKDNRIRISDGLRLVLMTYILRSLPFISSPNTDTFALTLTAYILIKWSEYLEDGNKEVEPYGWLCLMGIYACTLKLSSAFAMIILISPLYYLIANKQWKKLAYYILCSIVIILPFFWRNVMISGYILYPYAGIDIIPFIDWKMDAATIEYDRKEIMVWARGTFDVAGTYNWPLSKWIPVWLDGIGSFYRFFFGAAIISSAGLVMTNIYLIWKKEFSYCLLSTTSVVCLLGWLCTAPSVRFGEIYMWIPTCVLLLYWLGKWELAQRISSLIILIGICLCLYLGRIGISYFWSNALFNFNLSDYGDAACIPIQWEGITIYVPAQGDQAGYYYFPSTPYPDRLKSLELKGRTLRDGFRLK